MIGLNKIGLNQVQLNRLYLNAPFPVYRKMAGGGSSGDGFPVLPGDVTRWHFGGLTNEMMAAMDDPRIEDADHKGRFLSFKNFLWAGMSGVGGYEFNFLSSDWFIPSDQTIERFSHKIVIISKQHSAQLQNTSRLKSIKITIKVTGLEANGSTLRIYDNIGNDKKQDYNKDGIYKIDYTANEGANIIFFYAFGGNTGTLDTPITIEQLPLYPGFILGDGVDDFAVTEKELNFEDTYTVYTAFIPLPYDPPTNMVLCGKDYKKDFYVNYGNALSFYTAGTYKAIEYLANCINVIVCKRNATTALIKNLNTGESTEFTAAELIQNPGLYYLWKSATVPNYARAAIAGQAICNGHFTTDEEDEKVLNWHKKQYTWLFPDQAWTVVGKTNEDTDRATISNITGNGNNLVLSNFGFAENSGYGLYAYNFNSFTLKDNEVKPTDVKNDSFRIVGTGNGSNVSVLSNTSNSANWKIRVTGMKEGDNLIVGNANKSGDYFTITKDGIYTFQKQYEASSTNGVWYNSAQETDVLVEQIPEYEGYLVTDGVDDSGRAVNVTTEKDFTLVGEWKLFSDTSNNAGLSIHPQIHIFNRPESIQITFRSAGKTLPVKSLKAICSDGRCYDKDWNELHINVGNFTNNTGTLFVGSNGGNYTKTAFKNLSLYNNQIFSKEDCIKAYNYLQTLKAK